MLVPDEDASCVLLPIPTEKIPTPGAKISRQLPQFEKDAFTSYLSVAPAMQSFRRPGHEDEKKMRQRIIAGLRNAAKE